MQSVFARNVVGITILATFALQGCATTATTTASETISQQSRSIYVASEGDKIVMSDQDQCVRIISWSADKAIAECNASAKVAEVKAPGTTLVSYRGRAMFEFDSAQLTTAGKRSLDVLTARLNGQDEIKGIEVVGHTDNIGSEVYNQALSERRSESVKNYLQQSLRSVTVSASGLGESVPMADNNTDEGRAMNRRVDVNIAASIEQSS